MPVTLICLCAVCKVETDGKCKIDGKTVCERHFNAHLVAKAKENHVTAIQSRFGAFVDAHEVKADNLTAEANLGEEGEG